MNKNIIIPIYLAVLIMASFFTVKLLVLFNLIMDSVIIDWYEFFSVILFAPNFFIIIKEMISTKDVFKTKKEAVEDLLNKSCLVYKTDKDGNFIEVNDNFCRISRYERHELLGKNHSILNSRTFHLLEDDYGEEESSKHCEKIYQLTAVYKQIWHEVTRNSTKYGNDYIVKSWIKADFDKKSNFIGFTSVQQDLTKLLETSKIISDKEVEVSSILLAINKSNAVIEFCPWGNIMTANQNFLDIFGYELDEIQGKHHEIFVKNDTKTSESYKQFWEDLKKGEFKVGDFIRLNSKGEEVFISGTYNPILDGNGNCCKVLKIVSDITEIVKQKEEIEKANSYLEHAAKILRHDMHSGIHTYIPRGLSSLKRNLGKKKIKELKIESSLKLLEEGLTHSQKVYDGVREFTNLVKSDAELNKSVFNLKTLLKDFLKTTAYVDNVSISELIELKVNGPLFCTAIDNLIRNGLKYNDNVEKKVNIYMEKNDSENILVIEDNGRGLSQKEFEELSRPYARKNRQKENGSGLGLNICVAIIKEHNFKISCSKVKKGTKIKIKIPL